MDSVFTGRLFLTHGLTDLVGSEYSPGDVEMFEFCELVASQAEKELRLYGLAGSYGRLSIYTTTLAGESAK